MSLAPSERGLTATIRPDRAAASMRCLAKAMRLSNVCADAQPSSITTSMGPAPASPVRLFHNGCAMARMISAATAIRKTRIGQGVRAGSVSFEPSPMSRRSGGNTVRLGAGGVTRKMR